jgi:hypothetical protein
MRTWRSQLVATVLGLVACLVWSGCRRVSVTESATLGSVRELQLVLEDIASSCGGYPPTLAQTTAVVSGAPASCREARSPMGSGRLADHARLHTPEWELLKPNGTADVVTDYRFEYLPIGSIEGGLAAGYVLRAVPLRAGWRAYEARSGDRRITWDGGADGRGEWCW